MKAGQSVIVQLGRVFQFTVLLTVRLPGIQHRYFRMVASDLLSRYTDKEGQPCVINSLVPEGMSLGKGSLLINCNLKVIVQSFNVV